MKKILFSTILITGAIAISLNNVNTAPINTVFYFENNSAITLGYDKSMSEKTIKAAVIDSYFRDICKSGKIIRWNKSSMPLKVYIEDTASVPEYYQEVVAQAYNSWQRASEGLVRFEFVETPEEADLKAYFKDTDNKDSVGVHAFAVNGNTITDSVIVFNRTDLKGNSHDSKQLYSSALQEIGHSLGLTGYSRSIYDVMYPIGIKFNT